MIVLVIFAVLLFAGCGTDYSSRVALGDANITWQGPVTDNAQYAPAFYAAQKCAAENFGLFPDKITSRTPELILVDNLFMCGTVWAEGCFEMNIIYSSDGINDTFATVYHETIHWLGIIDHASPVFAVCKG